MTEEQQSIGTAWGVTTTGKGLVSLNNMADVTTAIAVLDVTTARALARRLETNADRAEAAEDWWPWLVEQLGEKQARDLMLKMSEHGDAMADNSALLKAFAGRGLF